MPIPNMNQGDWEHRLTVLSAWRIWRHHSGSVGDDGATYRAVLDGCAVTVRALCYTLDVGCVFTGKTISKGAARQGELLSCRNKGAVLLQTLNGEEQRCLLEVLYLGNRAVAHPKDGDLYHATGPHEMTVAINTLFVWLASKRAQWPALQAVSIDLLAPIA